MTVESPCNRTCTLDAADVCLGCGRTIDEIMAWAAAADEEKRRILAKAAGRVAERGGL